MSTHPREGRGRPRRASTDTAIHETARNLLRAQGPGAVNIDAVASRSGVARTTIYRRYRTREQLLHAMLDGLVEEPTPPPELPIEDKLRWVLDSVVNMLENGIGRGGTAAVLTDSDPEFSAALRSTLAGPLTKLSEAMLDDVRAGRLRSRVDPDALVGVLFGAYLAEVLLHREPRPGWVDRTAELLLPAIIPTPG